MDTYTKQLLHPRLKKHGGKWGRKIENARGSGVCFEIMSTSNDRSYTHISTNLTA